MARSFALPEIMDLASAGSIYAALTALRGDDVEIDASHVQTAGGLGLQILLAANKAWTRDGRTFRIVSPAAPFNDSCRLVGVDLPGISQ